MIASVSFVSTGTFTDVFPAVISSHYSRARNLNFLSVSNWIPDT